MASRSKQKTTMAKLARERAVQERRVRKQQRKDERKRAASVPPVAEAFARPDAGAPAPEPG